MRRAPVRSATSASAWTRSRRHPACGRRGCCSQPTNRRHHRQAPLFGRQRGARFQGRPLSRPLRGFQPRRCDCSSAARRLPRRQPLPAPAQLPAAWTARRRRCRASSTHHPGNAAHAPSAAVAIRFRSSKPTYSPPPHLARLLKAPLTRGRCQVSGYLNHASPQELQAPVRLPAHGRAPAPCSDRRAGAAPGSVSAHPALVGAGRLGNRIDTRWGAP